MPKLKFIPRTVRVPVHNPPFSEQRNYQVFKYHNVELGVAINGVYGHAFTHIESGRGFAENVVIEEVEDTLTYLEPFIEGVGGLDAFQKVTRSTESANEAIKDLVRTYLEERLEVPVTFKDDTDTVTLELMLIRDALKKRHPKTFDELTTLRDFLVSTYKKEVLATILAYA